MRNPPIIRAVVSDRFGEVLFDSDAPRYWRPGPARPPIVRRYAPPAAPVADPAAPTALALVCALVGAAIALGAIP